MKKILVLLVVLMALLPVKSNSQGLSSDGKDFYVGLLYPSFMNQQINYFGRNVQGFYGAYLLISSYSDNLVTISYFDSLGNEVAVQKYKVSARRAITVPLDIARTKLKDQRGEVVEYKSCHISAQKNISVEYFSTGSCSGGSYLALPTGTLGKSYVVESYHDNPGGHGGITSNEDAAGYFMIIGAYDNTAIEITPNSTTAKGRAGVNSGIGSNGSIQPFTISLNRGQCYMVKSTAGDISNDISGTTVTSSKPTVLIAGHENAFTDGSDIGNLTLEARDYMIEQMIPCEYWDSTGYVSIPFVDSRQPAPGGEGDEYHMFACNQAGAKIILNTNIEREINFSPKLYPNPVEGTVGVTTPVDFYSTNTGGKFHIMMYDQRMQGAGAPYPAPSQMSIVPISLWKSSFLWSVPANTFEILQGYYISLICRKVDYDSNNIQIAVNGGKLASIKASGLSVKKLWGAGTIPDHPELMGLTYAIGPAAYYATNISKSADNGFMIYNYGFRAIDPDRDLGDFCGDDHFFGYASPAGFVKHGDGRTNFSVTVDTLCAKWHVCVHLSGKNSPTIKQLIILDDPNGDFLRPGRNYHNSGFDLSVDQNNTREINLAGSDSVYCMDVIVPNPLDTAYAPLLILDNVGNSYAIDLRYKGSKLKLTTSSNFPNGIDSVIYPISGIGDKQCITLYYVNRGVDVNGDPAIAITAADLKANNPAFTITGTVPSLSTSLKPRNGTDGDTLAVTVCFNSKDTALHLDSLVVKTDCFTAPITLVGQGGTGLIYSPDIDFGTVYIGDTKCISDTIKNIGTLPFTLTKDLLLHNNIDFSIDPVSLAKLPVVIQPKGSFVFTVCISPTAIGFLSTTLDWTTDIKLPYTDQFKSKSTLKGNTVVPGIVWDRPIVKIFADTVTSFFGTARVFLKNNQSSDTYVALVLFVGQDSAEFKLATAQVYSPLEGFPMSPGGSIPVDLEFRPYMNKPQPARSSDRHAKLLATFYRDSKHTVLDTAIMDVIGVFDSLKLAVHSIPTKSNETTLSAYQFDRHLIVSIPDGLSGMSTCELYDLLGRKVYDWQSAEKYAIDGNFILPLPSLSEGSYILRLRNGNLGRSCLVMIAR